MSRNILTGGGASGGGGGVNTVSGTAPVTSSGGANPAIGIVPASAITAGSMSAADFSKLAALPASFPTFPVMTTGSVLFASGANTVAQDNANFFWDDTNNRLGIGTAVPGVALDVTMAIGEHGAIFPPSPILSTVTRPAGMTTSSESLAAYAGVISGHAADIANTFIVGQTIDFSGRNGSLSTVIGFAVVGAQFDYVFAAADQSFRVGPFLTGPLPALTEFNAVNLHVAPTLTFGVGPIATERVVLVERPTLAFAAGSVVTTAATLAIVNSPLAGANATITNAYALWVQAGITRLDGPLQAAGGITLPGLTQGSVLFAGAAGVIAQDNANFFFDDTANQLLMGFGSTANPSYSFAGDPGSGMSHAAPDGVNIVNGGLIALNLRIFGGVSIWQFAAGGLNLRDISGNSVLTVASGGPFRLDSTNVTQLLIPDGNFGAPGLAFTSSPTSGLYNGGSGAIRLQTAGILRARFGESAAATELTQLGVGMVLQLTGTALTGLTTELLDVYGKFARNLTFASGVNLGTQRSVYIERPTLIGSLPAGSAVSGNAVTFAIQGAPVQGANMILNNAYALAVEDGGAQIVNTVGNGGIGGGPGGVLAVSMQRSGVGLAANGLNLGMSLDMNGDPLDNVASILIGGLTQFSRNGSAGLMFGAVVLSSPGESITGTFMSAGDSSPNILGRTTTGDPLAASAESPWIILRPNDPLAQATWGTGALATQRFVVVERPTIAFAAASVVTNCASLAIANSPLAGANATITNAYALWVQAGITRLDGPLQAAGGVVFPSFTQGSVVFAGVGGALAQDNTNFFWDDATNRLGLGTPAPNSPLDITQNVSGATSPTINVAMGRTGGLVGGTSQTGISSSLIGNAADAAGSILAAYNTNFSANGGAAVSAAYAFTTIGSDPFALALVGLNDTVGIGSYRTGVSSIAASTEYSAVQIKHPTTYTWATGALATQRFTLVSQPIAAFAAASTITNCATLAIANSPAAGTNATITNAYALWVQAGITRLDGALQAAGGISLPTFTQGSVLFAGAAGAFTQDNANLFYDPTLNRLNVGNNAATQTGGTFNAEGDIGNVAGFGYVIGSLMDRTAGPAGAGNGVVNFYFDLEGNAADNATAFLNGNFAFLNKNGSAAQAAALSANGDQFDYTVTAFAQHLILGAQTAAAGAGFDSRLLASNGLTAGNGGNILISAGLHAGTATDGTVTVNNLSALAVTQGAQVLGAPSAFKVTAGASTGQTASTEVVDIDFALNRTLTHANGAIATQRSAVFRAPTHAFPGPGAQTITNCATVAITGAPITGANAVFTNAFALWSQSATDLCQFEGPVALGQTNGDVTMGIVQEGNYQVQFFGSPLQPTFAIGSVQGGTCSIKAPDLDTFQGGEILYLKAPVLTNQNVGGGTNELVEFRVDLDNINQFITGAAINTQRSVLFQPRTFTGTAATQTITTAAVVAILGPSVAGTNCVITNNYSLWVQAGVSRFDGGISAAHITGSGGTPTIATGTGAGTNATASVTGTDKSGIITVNTSVLDTPAASADIATITFASAYAAAPVVQMQSANDASWGLAFAVVRIRSADTTTTVFKLRSGTVPLPAVTSATYTFSYTAS